MIILRGNKLLKMEPKAGTSSDKPEEAVSMSLPKTKTASFPDGEKSQTILTTLHERRIDGSFCDIRLNLGPEKTVCAHRAILAAGSPFFEGMFMSSFMESTSDEVDLSHMTEHSDILELVIDSFYGRKFEINSQNVGELLNLATMLLMRDLQEICGQVMHGILTISTVVDIFANAVNYNLSELLEEVIPVVKARFHDFIMFQDTLYDYNVEAFEHLLEVVDLNFISRKTEFLQLLIKWYNQCESDERATLLVKVLENLPFEVTNNTFSDIEESITDIVKHLGDANSDVSPENAQNLERVFSELEPTNYKQFLQEKATTKNASTTLDLELYDIQEKEPCVVEKTATVLTCHNKDVGYTEKEEKAWAKVHDFLDNIDAHMFWREKLWKDRDAEWEEGDPPKPAEVDMRSGPSTFKSRKFRTKSVAELELEERLIDAVFVLAPTNARLCHELSVVVFIPRRKAWYKIGTLIASHVTQFNTSTSSSGSADRDRDIPHGRGFHYRDEFMGDYPYEDFDEDEFEMMHMIDPHMMRMMRDMPGRARQRLMEEMFGGRMPSSMLRRMMRDRDMSDMPRHFREMMMREALINHHRNPPPLKPSKASAIPLLTDPKWKMTYFKHKLYFCHDDQCESVFSYDLVGQRWSVSKFNAVNQDSRSSKVEILDGIDLAILGGTLVAVVRVAMFEIERYRGYGYGYDRNERDRWRHDCSVVFRIFKMDERQASWRMIAEIDRNSAYLDDEKLEKQRGDRFDTIQSLRPVGVLKTVLYVEDDEKLLIFLLQRQRKKKGEKRTVYLVTHVTEYYMDINEQINLLHFPDRPTFFRQVIPLYDSDMLLYVTDDLDADYYIDLATPGPSSKINGKVRWKPETNTEFIDEEKNHPKRAALTTSNGKSIWVLHGKQDATSSLTELTASCHHPTFEYTLNSRTHPPPPFKYFTMATAGMLDRNLLRTFGPPTKYLQDE